MRLCLSFCREGIRSSRYYWTRVLVGLTGGSHKWNRRLWETKNHFLLMGIEPRSLIFSSQFPHEMWELFSTSLLKLLNLTSTTKDNVGLGFLRYFKPPLRGWVVCLFPTRSVTHVSKLPSPQTSRWKAFWVCQILYWFWSHQTQAGIISGRYK
jgi:hypothetical protein